jgi:hypothetical protein
MTGHIKQILNAFNLPGCRVYTAENYKYFLDHGVESPELVDGLYIKGSNLVEYRKGKWGKEFDSYTYNNRYPNMTRNFSISNNIYDTDTHEYLGEFLRFQRDYLGVNLMPLYNCFSNRVCNNLNLALETQTYTTTEKRDANGEIKTYERIDNYGVVHKDYPEMTGALGEKKVIKKAFYSKDPNYVIYAVPVKFFKQYTIATESDTGIEFCCGLYNGYQSQPTETLLLNEHQIRIPPVNMSQFISNNTFKRFAQTRFSEPLLWEGIDQKIFDTIITTCAEKGLELIRDAFEDSDKINTSKIEILKEAYKQRLLKGEPILKLFIKVPVQSKTSITILEGDYHDFNNAKYAPDYVYKTYAINFEETINGEKVSTTTNLIEAKQIRWVKKLNHFVTNYETRLIGEHPKNPNGYTTTDLPEVEDRPFRPISPLQLLMFNTGTSYPFADRLMEYLAGNVVTEWDENPDNIRRAQKVMELNNNKFTLNGAWEGKMRNIIYDYMMNGTPHGVTFGFENTHDVLGYVDKDAEKIYTAWSFENCTDANGNRIPLMGWLPLEDENGNPVYDENGEVKKVYGHLQRKVNSLLEVETNPNIGIDSEKYKHSLLTELNTFLLTVKDKGGIPLYKQRYTPVANIQNINIYEEE